MRDKKNLKKYLWLHFLLLLYSLCGIFTKEAGKQDFLSWGFIVCYAGLLFILGIYALGWQQIIKRIPLTIAFANKAITILWGILWGVLFFHEKISVGKLVGAGIVAVGVILYTSAEKEKYE